MPRIFSLFLLVVFSGSSLAAESRSVSFAGHRDPESGASVEPIDVTYLKFESKTEIELAVQTAEEKIQEHRKHYRPDEKISIQVLIEVSGDENESSVKKQAYTILEQLKAGHGDIEFIVTEFVAPWNDKNQSKLLARNEHIDTQRRMLEAKRIREKLKKPYRKMLKTLSIVRVGGLQATVSSLLYFGQGADLLTSVVVGATAGFLSGGLTVENRYLFNEFLPYWRFPGMKAMGRMAKGEGAMGAVAEKLKFAKILRSMGIQNLEQLADTPRPSFQSVWQREDLSLGRRVMVGGLSAALPYFKVGMLTYGYLTVMQSVYYMTGLRPELWSFDIAFGAAGVGVLTLKATTVEASWMEFLSDQSTKAELRAVREYRRGNELFQGDVRARNLRLGSIMVGTLAGAVTLSLSSTIAQIASQIGYPEVGDQVLNSLAVSGVVAVIFKDKISSIALMAKDKVARGIRAFGNSCSGVFRGE